jgi:hypothetical protein
MTHEMASFYPEAQYRLTLALPYNHIDWQQSWGKALFEDYTDQTTQINPIMIHRTSMDTS